MIVTENSYEMHLQRHFDAPPSLVYRAFLDPVMLAQWFAPLTYHVPSSSIDVDARPGGHWRLLMVSNDDHEVVSPVNSTFTDVVENARLVGYETAIGFPGIEDGTKLTLTIDVIPEGNGTRLEVTQGMFPEFMRDMSSVGWTQSLFKLDALLQTPEQYRTPPKPEPEI